MLLSQPHSLKIPSSSWLMTLLQGTYEAQSLAHKKQEDTAVYRQVAQLDSLRL